MPAQTNYSFSTPKGVPGGLYDNSYHETNTRKNEESDGTLGFGVGVVQGTNKGQSIKLPDETSTAQLFEGVTIYHVTAEHDMSGKVIIKKDTPLGVIRVGKVWVKVADGVEVTYGDNLYLIKSGNDAGLFTNTAGDTAILVKGKFIGEVDNGIAPILLPNEIN